jgi:hypothetical protein
MSSDRRQVRLIKPSKHAAREAWLQARELRRVCAATVERLALELKAAKEALAHARDVEADNADEWESLLLEEKLPLADTAREPEGDFDPLRT